jgi:hypothetical protein
LEGIHVIIKNLKNRIATQTGIDEKYLLKCLC